MRIGKTMVLKSSALWVAAVIFFVYGCGGCHESDSSEVSHDGLTEDQEEYDSPTEDIPFDELKEPELTPPPDVGTEDFHDDEDEGHVDPCQSYCQRAPEAEEIGAACLVDETCGYGATCYTDDFEFFMGEMYINNPGGQCLIMGPGSSGCDLNKPSTCPIGATCVYVGSYGGEAYYGCLDACRAVDSADNVYAFNCGCRVGYQCDLVHHVCKSGCNHDRECCERWWDLNGDLLRSEDEVVVKKDCSNVCDNGGLYDDPPYDPGLCAVSFACINDGDFTNEWGGPCEGDAWCPPNGRCLDAFHHDIPCGICIKEACHYVGRGCEEFGGACANLGSEPHPYFACVKPCHTGRTADDPDFECRAGRGCEQACVPLGSRSWHETPGDGSDGYCWSADFPGGSPWE